MRELTYSEAAVEAVAEEMRRDPKIFYMSTDPIPSLLKEFGGERIRATPIAEAALTGMAIGAAGSGFRPIVARRQVTSALSPWTRSSTRRQRYITCSGAR